MARKKSPFLRVILALGMLSFAAAVLGLAFWEGLVVRHYSLTAKGLAAPMRIAVVSDLHNTYYGTEQAQLISALRAEAPDAVLFTGDIFIDGLPYDGAWALFSAIAGEMNCFYVSGNHDAWSGDLDMLKQQLRDMGVTVLDGNSSLLEKGAARVRICGVDDLDALPSPEAWQAHLDACSASASDDIFTLLLSHRPEYISDYANGGFDLVLAGHAHGGQARIPGLINGLFAPNVGWLPRYAGGQYTLGETQMIVSRGLCRNQIPRVFNPPELVIADLLPE